MGVLRGNVADDISTGMGIAPDIHRKKREV